jgi:hypothetical protein
LAQRLFGKVLAAPTTALDHLADLAHQFRIFFMVEVVVVVIGSGNVIVGVGIGFGGVEAVIGSSLSAPSLLSSSF